MGLRIVQYDPNDYKLGEALALATGESVEDSQRISQILSLYFQWKDSALCWAYTTKDKNARSQASLSYDEEERVATQLFVEVDKGDLEPGAEWVFLRLEIFENCFEFESRSLDWFEENGRTIAIIEIPKSASVVKNRRFPRVHIDSDITINWRANQESIKVKVKSISLGSIIVEGTFQLNTSGTIEAAGVQYPACVTRGFDGFTSIKLLLADNLLTGAWFDFYRLYAYPNLKKRSDLDSSQCLQLYSESGYFSKYKTGTLDAAINEIKQAWHDNEQLDHLATADYAVTSEGLPVGIGSTSFTYSHQGKEFWTFHSLCALRNNEDLDLTKALYSWRAEYNFARVENMDTLLFFSSQSRWIERVYINFILRKQQSGVAPIRLYTITYAPVDHGLEVIHKVLSTEHKRLMISKDGIVAAALPDLIHIRKKLNCIVVNDLSTNHLDIQHFGEQIAFEAKREITFRVSVPESYSWRPELDLDLPTDRLGVLRKEDLMDFVASLSHSIEVTKRKKNLA